MPRIVPASDRALLVVFDGEAGATELGVRRLAAWLREAPPDGTVDVSPAYETVLVRYDPLRVATPVLIDELERRVRSLPVRDEPDPRTFEIPVAYGGRAGVDLAAVAKATGLSAAEVIEAHAGASYRVRFLGFSPGFPYLEGLPSRLFTPRQATPRIRVAAGSVAIAGSQAGIYPLASPGGWNVIGRTDFPLFDPRGRPMTTLRAGDHVRFVAFAGSA